ncbi:MAG: hypothetical protein QNJ68_20360 [Microcoleaceae cyanobacterium MO_207.B10]|nr:hypothetical protein [Microcoleaceae cyanobacterium MO_207.B10]
MTYKTQAQDTTIEAEKLQFILLKKNPIQKRIQQYKSCSRKLKSISGKLFKDNHPYLTSKQLKQKYIKSILGAEYSGINKLIETEFMINDAIELAAKIGKILEHYRCTLFCW